LKQRLLGAIIIVALMVILVPEWLDGSGHRSRYPKTVEIPPEPVIKPIQDIPVPAPVVQPAPAPKPESPKPAETFIPKTDVTGWTLQVGSFKDKDNARTKVDQLKAAGYPAYVDTRGANSHTQYRVRIGSAAEKQSLEKMNAKLQSSGLAGKGLIVRYP